MIFRATHPTFILQNRDGLPKRMAIFVGAVLVWWLSEHYLRPFCGPAIQQWRNHFGNGPFVQNILSQSLPVDIACFILLILFCRAKIIPAPQICGSLATVGKEGTLWGLLICAPTIPLAFHLGFHLGFAPNWQSILGNIVSNSYEELTYRVFLFSVAAYAFKNLLVGIIISAFLFAVIHTQYPLSMQVIVGLASAFFSFSYLRSKSLFGAIWAHQLSDMILDTILVQ